MEDKTSSNAVEDQPPAAESPPEEVAPETDKIEEPAEEAAAGEDAESSVEPEEAAVPEEDAAPETTADEDTAETLVQVDGLKKHYGQIKAVDGISFSVRRGEVLGFLGPNGAGKTTAMRLITGFLHPDAGRVEVSGHDLATASLEARQKIGYLPENAPAYGEMTVVGFLEFVAETRQLDDVPGAIARVVAMTGLQGVQHQIIETLSKGYKRRVGLAQALIHDPEVLILDEPTDGLDPNQKAVVQNLLANLSSNKCIIVSTHILDEVERICNRAMIISQGKILVDSTPNELISRAPNHNTIRLTLHDENPGLAARLEAEPWCERVETSSDATFDVYPVGGENHLIDLLELVKDLPLQDVRLQEGRLDDLFREVTEGVAT